MLKPKLSKSTIATIITIIVALASVSVSTIFRPRTSYSLNLPASAKVSAVGEVAVTWDITGTQPVESVDFGKVYIGGNKSVGMHITNKADHSLTGTLAVLSWEPEIAGDYITLDWDFGTTPLRAGRIRKTHLILSVSPSIENVTYFSLSIQLTFS